MKVPAITLAIVVCSSSWMLPVVLSATNSCDIEKEQLEDEYVRAIESVCNASRMNFEGTFVFVESGLWPVPNYFLPRVDASPDLSFSSLDILTGTDPARILRGALRISNRTETKYDGDLMLVDSDAIDYLVEACGVNASLFQYEVELPLAGQRIRVFELHFNRTIIAIRDFDNRMIDAMTLAFARLNCY